MMYGIRTDVPSLDEVHAESHVLKVTYTGHLRVFAFRGGRCGGGRLGRSCFAVGGLPMACLQVSSSGIIRDDVSRTSSLLLATCPGPSAPSESSMPMSASLTQVSSRLSECA